MTTAILTDTRHEAHTDPAHVERAERLIAIHEALDDSGLLPNLISLTPSPPSNDILELVHSRSLLQQLERLADWGGGRIDSDTYMTAESWEVATLSAGASVQAVAAVLRGEVSNAFALMRPPGHHATPTRAMGFCLLNNIAIAARYAIEVLNVKRVAIVDYDVHHGNGTQDSFYNDDKVLFCSVHSDWLYPGTGFINEYGSGSAEGTTLNVPLPHGVGDHGYKQVFNELILPAVRRFRPELLLVSAGFDAHRRDPLGTQRLSTAGYTELTRMLYDTATQICDGQLVLTLEGGYDLQALSECCVAATQVLLGHEKINTPPAVNKPEPDIRNVINALQRNHPLLCEA